MAIIANQQCKTKGFFFKLIKCCCNIIWSQLAYSSDENSNYGYHYSQEGLGNSSPTHTSWTKPCIKHMMTEGSPSRPSPSAYLAHRKFTINAITIIGFFAIQIITKNTG